MKHLFVARHGDSYDDINLSNSGRTQIEELGKAIKGILNNGSAYIFSSTSLRAMESSQILAEQLNLPGFEEMSYLAGGERPDGYSKWENNSLERLMEIVNERKEKAEGLIMVTHLDVTNDFLGYFLMKEFGVEETPKWMYDPGIYKGRAVDFNLEKRDYQIIPK